MVSTYTLRYTALEVTDLDRTVNFYQNALGMKLAKRIRVTETKGELGIMKSEGPDHWLEINWYPEHQFQSGDQLDHLAFEVENLDHALAELQSKGISPISYIRESESSRWPYIADPDGVWIEIFQKNQKV